MDQEKMLAVRLQSGDKEALFSMMLTYYNDMFRYALKFTADPELTKELVNQFSIHLWDNRDKFYAAQNIKPYLIVSFKRFLIAWYRKQKSMLQINTDEHDRAVQPYETYIIAAEKQEAVKNALQQALPLLSKRQKQLVQLRFYEQMTYEEISQKTSLTIRTIYNKLHEALKKLRSNTQLEKMKNY
jgi:RNA polymerase sigma factor (sigma-70 family)